MSVSADSRPHFTTIAEFISSMSGQIGKTMFAVDGCKIRCEPRQGGGGPTASVGLTKAGLRKKAEKIEQSVKMLLDRHRSVDATAGEEQHYR